MVRSNNGYLNSFLIKAAAVRVKNWKIGVTGLLTNSRSNLVEQHLLVDVCGITQKEIDELQEKQLTRIILFWENNNICRFYKAVLLNINAGIDNSYTIEFKVREV